VQRAAGEIRLKQEALHQAQADLVKMRLETLANNTQIEVIRKAIEGLAVASKAAPLNQVDEAQLRKEIDAIITQIEKLRAR